MPKTKTSQRFYLHFTQILQNIRQSPSSTTGASNAKPQKTCTFSAFYTRNLLFAWASTTFTT